MKHTSLGPPLAALLLASSCTLASRSGPPRLVGNGIVDGHIALGIAAEDRVVHASLFDGRSPGSLAELSIWKLFRIELGLAGASLSLGPLHLGLGVLAYDPWVPRMQSDDDHEAPHAAEDSFSDDYDPDCPACRAERHED